MSVMSKFFRKLFNLRFISIQTKFLLPLAPSIFILYLTVLPVIDRVLTENLEKEADRQLVDIANSATDVIQSSETLARNNAILIAQQPTIISAFDDLDTARKSLEETKHQLGLQELSLYSPNILGGDPAYYYGGPIITRRLQVSTDGTNIRESALIETIREQSPASEVIITPQGSQIIGTAPVFEENGGKLIGVVLTAYFLDDAFIENVSRITGADIGIVKNNAIIASTIQNQAAYVNLINNGWLESSQTPSTNIDHQGKTYHMLAYKLTISGEAQGYLLIAQPIDHLFNLEKNLRSLFMVILAIFSGISIWFWWASVKIFINPLFELTSATTKISQGNLNEHITVKYLLFRDEITTLSENFNAMVDNLHALYESLEDKVSQRTKELEVAASTDELTKAYNRSYFIRTAEQALKHAQTNNTPFSIILFDVDDFKAINDTYGHLHGDEVLREITRQCKKNIRPNDVFARYGGEEFILLLPGANEQTARNTAERLCSTVANSVIESNPDTPITISVGVASYKKEDKNLDDLLRKADIALYKAKDEGKNRVQIA